MTISSRLQTYRGKNVRVLQLQPPHGGHVPSSSQLAVTSASSGSTPSGSTTPSTGGQAPLPSVETTPAASP